MLYLVPTPIGNLDDMTVRAVKTLQEASLILAEDTRTSRPLLNHFNITTPVQAHHLFNEHQRERGLSFFEITFKFIAFSKYIS